MANISQITLPDGNTYDIKDANAATESYVDTGLASKQDALTAGTGINIDANNVISATGGGTITDVQVDGTSVVTSGVAQIDLTPYAESDDLATVATSGSYTDLTNKPTIPAAQVNSDWNASSGVAEILNKPNLATVATSGSYSDLSNTPTLGTASALNVPASGDASATEVVKGDDTRLTDARNAADVYSWAKASTKPSYTASEVGAVSTADGIVYGGTLSSAETIDLNDAQFRTSKARTIYWLQIGSNTSNAPISSGYGNLECHHYMQRFTTYSSGRTYIRWYVNNVWSAWKEINTTYTFEEGSVNGAFSVTPSGGSEQSVSIHGLGEYTTKDGSATNVATGTYTTLTSLAITAGTYLVEYQASFNANANGMRRIFITQSSTSTSANPQFSYINVQNTGASYGTALNGMVIVKTSNTVTLYLRAYHDAGVTLSTTGRIGTLRIK